MLEMQVSALLVDRKAKKYKIRKSLEEKEERLNLSYV
jgi:hypothetical protein